MKSLLIILITTIPFHSYSQVDKNGNPIVNSSTINEIQLDNFKLSISYYSLVNNIDNPSSAVYISKSPSHKDIEKAALEIPSYFYLVIKNQEVINIITLNTYPSNTFLVVDPKTNKYRNFKTTLKGEISENRATEFMNGNFDLLATINNGFLYFNNKKLEIIEYKAIEEAVLKLIAKEKLAEAPEERELNDFYKLIIDESKPGGKLDVFTEIKGKEKERVILFNHLESYENVALYQWGRLVLAAGMKSPDDVLLVYSKLRERALSKEEMKYIIAGFNKEWEK